MRLLIVVVLAGCLEPALVECPDGLACPNGTVCGPSGGCFAPEDLAACDGIDSGTPCTGGFCIEGICVPDACGNRAQTPGEVCDDGNTVNGDGCSADCRSTEVCGNGIADTAAGEQCDDGNFIAGDSCEPGCLLPRCGDGIVDGIEECDPQASLTTDRTCDDFGYYTGTLACNDICRLDPTTGCTGRCGDGVVQTTREDCDGGPPASSCLDFGYDLGALACSPVCAADPVRSCDRYGWEDLGEAISPPRIRANGDLAITLGPVQSPLSIYDANGVTMVSGSYVAADVRAGAILRATSTAAAVRANGSTTFDPLPALGLVAGQAIVDAVFADDGTPMLLVATGSSACNVYNLAGASWTITPTIAGCERIVARTALNFVVRTSDTLDWKFPGGTRSHTSGGLRQIDFLSDATIAIYAYSAGVVTRLGLPTVGPGSSTATIASGSFRDIVMIGDVVYAIDNAIFGTQLYRYGYGRTEQMDASPSTTGAPSSVALSREKRIYGGSNSHLYRFDHVTKTTRSLPVADISINSRVAIALDGTLVFCGAALWRSTGATWESVTSGGASVCSALFARSGSDIYLQRNVSGTDQLVHYNGSLVTETFGGSPILAQRLAGDGAIVVAVTATNLLRKVGSGAWSALPSIPTGCTSPRIAVRGGVTYLAGDCGTTATVWKYDGAAWIVVHEEPGVTGVTQLLALDDGTIWFVATNAIFHGTDGGTWTRIDGTNVLAIAPSGSRLFAIQMGQLREWTGSRWAVVRSIANSNVTLHHVFATATDLVAAGVVGTVPTIKWASYVLPP